MRVKPACGHHVDCISMHGLIGQLYAAQVETNTMSASDHDGKKDDKGGAANYSAINLNKDFLQKLKEDGECLGGSGG